MTDKQFNALTAMLILIMFQIAILTTVIHFHA
jgi:hypothetical protein